MKTLIYGAGPLGCLYAHRRNQAGKDVALLARGQRFDFLEANGLVLVDEHTGAKECSKVKLTRELGSEDVFMGNNALGFDEYLRFLPQEKLLFGFPGAGGEVQDQVVHYVDREKADGKRRSLILGEIDGKPTERIASIASFFESSGVSVSLTQNVDGWLKYHIAMILPLASGLYKYHCDNYALAKDEEMLRTMVRAAVEGGRVLKAIGFRKREPFQFNLFYWLPEIFNVKALQKILESRFAEIAFGLHARAARDEVRELAFEFESLARKTSLETPNIDKLREYIR